MTRGSPRSVALSTAAVRPSRSSAGTCHAPHTTATVSCPSLSARRIARRMWASRRSSRADVTVPARAAIIASATASNAGAPSPRCSITSSHHRSGSASPAAAANSRKGSGGADISDEFVGRPLGEGDGHREVDGDGGALVRIRPGDRLPLGAEGGERREDRPAGLVGHVAEQGNGRDEAVVADPRQARFDVGRGLDQQDVRVDLVERPDHRPR